MLDALRINEPRIVDCIAAQRRCENSYSGNRRKTASSAHAGRVGSRSLRSGPRRHECRASGASGEVMPTGMASNDWRTAPQPLAAGPCARIPEPAEPEPNRGCVLIKPGKDFVGTRGALPLYIPPCWNKGISRPPCKSPNLWQKCRDLICKGLILARYWTVDNWRSNPTIWSFRRSFFFLRRCNWSSA